MLRLEDEGTRRPLMHVHIRYWLRSSIRIASVPLLAADCCTSAYPGLCGDIHNANRKNLRYDSFGKSCAYPPVVRVLSVVENLWFDNLALPKIKSQ